MLTAAKRGTVFLLTGNCHHDRGSPGQMEGSKDLYCCGKQPYNILNSYCCNGTVTKGLSQLVVYCCGSKAYNPLNEICCEGTISIRDSPHTKCCGNKQYQTKTHKCCGNGTLIEQNKNDCCGSKSFDKATHCCCTDRLQVQLKSDPCCQSKTDFQKTTESRLNPPPSQFKSVTKALHNNSDLKCGSYDHQTQICCSGHLYKKSSELTMCCGKDIYSFSESNVLCCNGVLKRDQPEQSECVGGVIFSPANTTCHLSVRPRLGEHCCGGQTFNPLIHICCNGHRHDKKNGNFCCGSEVYDHRKKFLKCCSDHLYNTSNRNEKAECCGNLLLENNMTQTCCSSSTHAIKYVTKSNHSCCGHHYYNRSLWSCCADHLKPTPEAKSPEQYKLKPLLDLIPEICKKKVFFGKVESMTLNISRRHVLLKVVWKVNSKSDSDNEDPWLNVLLDHCNSPALENGMIYLWEKNEHNEYNLLSHPVDLTSDIHMFYFFCYQLNDHKNR